MRFVFLALAMGLVMGYKYNKAPEIVYMVKPSFISDHAHKMLANTKARLDKLDLLMATSYVDQATIMELTYMGQMMQLDSNDLMIEMIEATGYKVSATIDPCGDNLGYDNVIFRLSTNTLVQYDGVNFIVLTPGSYAMNDTGACAIDVTSTMRVCSGGTCE